MRIATTARVGLLMLLACLATSAYGQTGRTVTLTLNMATNPDTTRLDDLIEVRGNASGVAPATLKDGNVISWDDASTLEPMNVGGDYWRLQFEIADTTELTFKFFSTQSQDAGVNGWEADPNPVIPPGTGDTTLTLHYFESQSEWHGVSGDRGDYDWRPFASKEDSVAVWFRVAMFGTEADADGYDPALGDTSQAIGVRGTPLANSDSSALGPVDWGSSNVVLNRESTNENAVGYRLYSGVAYYPNALVGIEQAYKFVLDAGGSTGWEEGNLAGNRTFTVPAADTTLQWMYFGDTPPVAVDPVTSNVVFGVDLSAFETAGVFDVARGDTLWVYGDFNNWQNCKTESPDRCLMEKIPGESEFGIAVPITKLPNIEFQYKYFLDFNDERFMDQFGVPPPSGWEEGHLTGINRRNVFAGDQQQILPLAYFNDVTPQNLILPGTSVEVAFSVDMTGTLTDDAQPFNPAGGDTVSIRLGDPIWAHTQGIDGTDHDIPLTDLVQLTDPDGDNIYTGTWTISGPTYNVITFKYMYGQSGTFVNEMGSDTGTPGRNRARYIPRNADGSWPASFALPEASFALDPGPLPHDTNPFIGVGIEEVSSDVPNEIWLGGNYPNPFNPTTTFEYSLTQADHVKIHVYDVLGRRVATLVDGVQHAATYQITFNASDLASGVYFYALETSTTSLTRRMLLIK